MENMVKGSTNPVLKNVDDNFKDILYYAIGSLSGDINYSKALYSRFIINDDTFNNLLKLRLDDFVNSDNENIEFNDRIYLFTKEKRIEIKEHILLAMKIASKIYKNGYNVDDVPSIEFLRKIYVYALSTYDLDLDYNNIYNIILNLFNKLDLYQIEMLKVFVEDAMDKLDVDFKSKYSNIRNIENKKVPEEAETLAIAHTILVDVMEIIDKSIDENKKR